MPVHSAGLMLFRRRGEDTEVFLVHPGGPFWKNKDEHAWSIPKGEFDPEAEEALDAAKREFAEETGLPLPEGEYLHLGEHRAGSKRIHAWAVEADADPDAVRSNTFTMEWPPRGGRQQEFPEVDRAAWFPICEARSRLHKGQAPLPVALEEALSRRPE